MFGLIEIAKNTLEIPAEMSEIAVINDNNNFAHSLFRSFCVQARIQGGGPAGSGPLLRQKKKKEKEGRNGKERKGERERET